MPNYVVEACFVNAFKVHLDKIWLNQDFTAILTGTGNQSYIKSC